MKKERVEVRSTAEQKVAWMQAAERGGVSLTDWITQTLNEGAEPKSVEPDGKPRQEVARNPNLDDAEMHLLVCISNRIWIDRSGEGKFCEECKIEEQRIHRGWCGLGDRMAMRAKEELNVRRSSDT